MHVRQINKKARNQKYPINFLTFADQINGIWFYLDWLINNEPQRYVGTHFFLQHCSTIPTLEACDAYNGHVLPISWCHLERRDRLMHLQFCHQW